MQRAPDATPGRHGAAVHGGGVECQVGQVPCTPPPSSSLRPSLVSNVRLCSAQGPAAALRRWGAPQGLHGAAGRREWLSCAFHLLLEFRAADTCPEAGVLLGAPERDAREAAGARGQNALPECPALRRPLHHVAHSTAAAVVAGFPVAFAACQDCQDDAGAVRCASGALPGPRVGRTHGGVHSEQHHHLTAASAKKKKLK